MKLYEISPYVNKFEFLRRRSTRLASMEEDPLAIRPETEQEEKFAKTEDSQHKTPSKKTKPFSGSSLSNRKKTIFGKEEEETCTIGKIQNTDYHTPTKKSKDIAEGTPTHNRRKSILKSATTRLGM